MRFRTFIALCVNLGLALVVIFYLAAQPFQVDGEIYGGVFIVAAIAFGLTVAVQRLYDRLRMLIARFRKKQGK